MLYTLSAGGTGSGVTSIIAGNGISVSGAVGNVTVSAKLNGTTLLSAAGGLSLNLANANTWTAIQTFTNSDIVLLGSSTGGTTFTSANAGASNFTLTFPAVTDTLAVLGANQTFTGSEIFNLPDAGSFTINDDSGVMILKATDGGAGSNTLQSGVGLQVFSATARSTQVLISAFTGPDSIVDVDGSNNLRIDPGGVYNSVSLRGGGFYADSANNANVIGKFAVVKNIATVGATGVPVVYAVGVQTLSTNAAPATLSLTPPATAGVYVVSGYLDVLTAATLTFKVNHTYKDPGGNARADPVIFVNLVTGAITVNGPAANATGRYAVYSFPFAIDNSATAITIVNNAGTYTSGTYYWVPVIQQIA